MESDLDNARDEYSDKLMHLQMEHGKKLLAAEHRLKRSREAIEEKDAQIARLTGATSTDTSIAMAMNVKTEVKTFVDTYFTRTYLFLPNSLETSSLQYQSVAVL